MQWLADQDRPSLFPTTVTQAAVLCSIEMLPAGSSKIAAGRALSGRPISQSDAMISAIARARGAAIATRNTTDFEHCGVSIVNPWRG